MLRVGGRIGDCGCDPIDAQGFLRSYGVEPPRFRLHARTLGHLLGVSQHTTPFVSISRSQRRIRAFGSTVGKSSIDETGLLSLISVSLTQVFCRVRFFLSFILLGCPGQLLFFRFFFFLFFSFLCHVAEFVWVPLGDCPRHRGSPEMATVVCRGIWCSVLSLAQATVLFCFIYTASLSFYSWLYALQARSSDSCSQSYSAYYILALKCRTSASSRRVGCSLSWL